MTVQRYRLGLAITWLVGGGVILLTMITQTTLDYFGDDAQQVWEWLFPNILPTLTLVLGVTGFVRAGTDDPTPNTRMLYMLALGMSIFYLLALGIPIFLQPFSGTSPLDTLRQANLYLAPLQGLTSTLLGVFFAREVPKPELSDTQ